MNRRLAWLLPLPLLLRPPLLAETCCAECIKAVEEDLRLCLDQAISVEDKGKCEDARDEQLRACEEGECRIEREDPELNLDVSPRSESTVRRNLLGSTLSVRDSAVRPILHAHPNPPLPETQRRPLPL